MPYTCSCPETGHGGYRMCEHERAAHYLSIRKEYLAISEELTGLTEALLKQADTYAALSAALRTKPDTWFLDKPTQVLGAVRLCEVLARYKDLLFQKADKKTRSASFGETFAALEP
jgi:hypothetical protein